MFDRPFVIVVIVEKINSILHFFDYDLVTFSSNRTCIEAFNALQVLKNSPANVVTMEMNIDETTGAEMARVLRDIDEKRKNLT
jgi:response regulator RpfG family c-di-GMP phosphodiesterase